MSILQNLGLFVVIASMTAYGTFLVLGKIVNAQSQNEVNKVVLRDSISQRSHSLSGMVMVPSSCHKLIARVKAMDMQNYLLNFRIWEDPNQTCKKDAMPQRFNMTLLAPSTGISFQATLDDIPIPLEVIQTIAP